MRAVAALLVIGTHAAFATGKLTHGYLGAVYARLEIGVALFFVLSGFLLFRPWVVAAATDDTSPGLSRYARHRLRRIMPAYLVTVLATFELYVVFTPGPNPGQTWHGLLRHLTLTQIYTTDYLTTYLHPGLSQMWSLAVEVSFYAALPAIAYVLLRRRRPEWRPARVLTALAVLGLVTPAWLDDCFRHRPTSEFGGHVAASAPRVFRGRHGVGSPSRRRCAVACACRAAVGGCAVSRRRDTAWGGHRRTRTRLGGGHQGCLVCGHRDVGSGRTRAWRVEPVCAGLGQPTDGVARRDLIRTLSAARGRHGGDDESGVAVAAVHRIVGGVVRGNARSDDPVGMGTASGDWAEAGTDL